MEWASNDQIVITMCQSHKPDLVIIDMDKSVIEEVKIETELKKRYPKLPIIVLITGDASDTQQPLPESFDDYILKPIKTKSFLDTINKYLG